MQPTENRGADIGTRGSALKHGQQGTPLRLGAVASPQWRRLSIMTGPPTNGSDPCRVSARPWHVDVHGHCHASPTPICADGNVAVRLGCVSGTSALHYLPFRHA